MLFTSSISSTKPAETVHAGRITRHFQQPVQTSPRVSGKDSVELSDEALAVTRPRTAVPPRMHMVARIREELARGVYDIDSKLDVAIDRMLARR